jgi:nucleotide-binding universal stress UspA family protein
MFHRVVVPLDGSALAETVLADVFTIAFGREPEVLLLSVLPSPSVFAVADLLQERAFRGDVAIDPDALVPAVEHELTAADEARMGRYLDPLAERLAASGLRARTQVRIGDAATEIVRCAREEQADAIAMSTHRRTGLDRLRHGSVAEAVLRTAGLPVLVVRPDPANFARHRSEPEPGLVGVSSS